MLELDWMTIQRSVKCDIWVRLLVIFILFVFFHHFECVFIMKTFLIRKMLYLVGKYTNIMLLKQDILFEIFTYE